MIVHKSLSLPAASGDRWFHIVHIKQLQLPAAWKQSLGPVECEAEIYHASFVNLDLQP